MVELNLVKGTVDRLPEEQLLREKIQSELQRIFQLYGFRPAKTPILEDLDVLASKYSGGAEILKEIYTLTDQGKRKLALRYDLSVPLARLVGMHPELPKPFKRYEMGECFRDGPVRKGRYREFNQCDIDTIGVIGMAADAEILKLTHHAFSNLGIEVIIQVNNRKLLSGILKEVNIPDTLIKPVILTIDKLEKIGKNGVTEELLEKNISEDIISKIFTFLEITGDYNKILDELEPKITNETGKQGIKELRELFNFLAIYNIEKDVTLLYTLARGLEIYTGTVFEVFLKDKSILDSALAGGGRYDEIIQKFANSKTLIPAVGISFGLDTIYDTLRIISPVRPHVTQVYVIPIKTPEESMKIVTSLRDAGISVEYDLLGRSISKNMEMANKFKIPYVIIVGKRDLKENKITVKNMSKGTEEQISITKIVDYFKK